MTKDELITIIDNLRCIGTESSHIELKAGKGGFPSIIDSVSAFANQDDGGIILIGIDETDMSICGVLDPKDYVKKVQETCDKLTPIIVPTVTPIAVDNEHVVIAVEIPGLPFWQRPCYITSKGVVAGSYVRSGDGDIRMPERTIFEHVNYTERTFADQAPIHSASVDDLQTPMLDKYKYEVSVSKPLFSKCDTETLLRKSGFLKGDTPTLAGLMLLSDYPQQFLPQACVSARVFGSNDLNARMLDSLRIEGNIPQMLKDTLSFIRRNTRHPIIIKDGKRIDVDQYPETALRELVLNALIHRDYSRYSDGESIELFLYPDKLIIASPGLLYGRVTMDNLYDGGLNKDVRNPYIVNGMETLGFTENRGTGITAAVDAMTLAGLKPPQFYQDFKTCNFIVTLRSKIGRQNDESNQAPDTKYFD